MSISSEANSRFILTLDSTWPTHTGSWATRKAAELMACHLNVARAGALTRARYIVHVVKPGHSLWTAVQAQLRYVWLDFTGTRHIYDVEDDGLRIHHRPSDTRSVYLATCTGALEWLRDEPLGPPYGPDEDDPVIVLPHLGRAFALIGADLGFAPVKIDGTWDDDEWNFVDFDNATEEEDPAEELMIKHALEMMEKFYAEHPPQQA